MSTGSAEGLRALGGAASCAVPPREQGRSSHLSRASRAGAGQTLPGQGKELWRGGRGRWGGESRAGGGRGWGEAGLPGEQDFCGDGEQEQLPASGWA